MSELYELPEGWEWKKMEDVFLIERGGSPRPIKDYITEENDGINWIKIGDTKKGEKYITQTAQKIKPEGLKKSRLVIEGDFLMSNSMSFGRPYIVKTKGAIHDGWLLMREKIDDTDKDFFYYLLSSNYMYQQFLSKASGTTVKNLNINLVKLTNIPLPPFKEQKRIVAKLDKLFEKIDMAIALHQKNMDEADIFMKSVLNDVFRELEEKYEKKQFQNIFDNYDGKRVPIKASERENKSGKYPYYGASGIIDYVNDYIFDGEYLLVSEDGANLTARKYPIAFIANGKFWVNNHAHILKAKSNISTNKFMEYALAHTDISDYITGSAQPKMSQRKMNIIEFSIPPLNIQQKTVTYLNKISKKIENLKKVQKEKMQSLVTLKASILDRAFRGH